MAKHTINYEYTMVGEITIEADTFDDAAEQVVEMSIEELEPHSSYLEGSFDVNYDFSVDGDE